MRLRHVIVAVLAAVAACAKPEPKVARPQRPNWLLDVPYLAQSVLEDTTGTPDAQHVVLLAPATLDSVARFYRHRLPPMGWRVMSDVSDSLHVSLSTDTRVRVPVCASNCANPFSVASSPILPQP